MTAEKAMDADVLSQRSDSQVEQLSQSSEPLEPESEKKHGKYNLRQSLAWDTAFFTSEGMLWMLALCLFLSTTTNF